MTGAEIDIRPSCLQMLRDLGHPFAEGEPVYDITFENVQAGERTSHLFRLANFHNALVLGTGDLSETGAGLGHLRRGRPDVALQRQRLGAQDADPVPDPLGHRLGPVRRARRARSCSRSSTRRSRPSWCRTPSDAARRARAEHAGKIGPYELQDFNLYYITRYGFRPSKVAF